MYLRVHKCFLYRKELKFKTKSYRNFGSHNLNAIQAQFLYLKVKSSNIYSIRNARLIGECSEYWGTSTDLVSELNGIYVALINFYSTRNLAK